MKINQTTGSHQDPVGQDPARRDPARKDLPETKPDVKRTMNPAQEKDVKTPSRQGGFDADDAEDHAKVKKSDRGRDRI